MKKKVALVTGGYSGEAAISYKSAVTFYNNLKNRFDIYTVDITPKGWFYEDEKGNKTEIDKNDFSLQIKGQKVTFDVIFIGIHGTPGEDGKLQGYFDMLELPYTSCNMATSSLTFNKRYTTAVAAAYGIPVANSVLLIKSNFQNPDELAEILRFPVFVKPNNGGSSIGMSRVNQFSHELGVAIEKAFKEDNQVLVEEMITGRETWQELEQLADDVYQYFGLGCRNVTKIYVPGNYDFEPLLKAFKKYDRLADHNKYKNNYDYNLAILLLNHRYYMTNGSILLVEDKSYFSPISQLNYEYYEDKADLQKKLHDNQAIQCVISDETTGFGKGQQPQVCEFADGIDTMAFLRKLSLT